MLTPVELAALVLLDHALGHERLQQAVRGGLREAHRTCNLRHAPAFGLHRAERADHRKDARDAAAGGRRGFHALLLWNSKDRSPASYSIERNKLDKDSV
ncbi:hypothetical protein ABID97_000815 [Variovorax sp. OAS795]